MRSIGPAVTREQSPAFLRNSNGRLDLPGPTQEALSDCVQDLATVDVLRDIDYPPCAYWCWYIFCVYVYAHTHLNYVAREYIYIRRGLRVVGLTQWAMRRPQLVERQQSDSTLFLYAH